MRVTNKMVARAVLAFRQSDETLIERRMHDALEYALAAVPDTADDRLQDMIAQFREMLEDARSALEKLQAKLLALTALGSPRIEDATLVEEKRP